MSLRGLLLENKAWVAEKLQVNPNYFAEMAKDQTPAYLWIGCSDSRVNPSEMTGTGLGEMFVHRNIANLVHEDDLNLMSVITYAVQYLKIKHIIVCGHYGCGGVAASLTTQSFGIIDGWLKNIKSVISKYGMDLEKFTEGKERVNALVEFNVKEQVKALNKIDWIAQKVKDKELSLHGWVYDMSGGLLKDIAAVDYRATGGPRLDV